MKTIAKSSFSLYLILFLLTQSILLKSQDIPKDSVIRIDILTKYLKLEVLATIVETQPATIPSLASYFRNKFSERFFYDWKTFNDRFDLYNQTYDKKGNHTERAQDHMQKFKASTNWKLPFNYQNGEEVNAYALRHLARQHKMLDISYLYFYDDRNTDYIQYFTKQMKSLNVALENEAFETIDDGNGVYESFRAGYRVLNWLSIHNMFLGEKEYSDEDQLYTIATLLQHGAFLYEINDSFQSGNHQTRGVSALAMLAILLRDFEGTDQWYERAMTRLMEHLNDEINPDGFQFERSVHYHISDISNFFYVYQLAKISNIQVDKVWETKLKSLFETLTKIAYPDKSAPVLQDDTDNPWAEKNEISETLALGYLLFNEPEFGYLSADKVEASMYWFMKGEQLKQLSTIEKKKPEYGSLEFPDTQYYIMREGWDADDKMMVISAGLDDKKPDHQHGDMLGIQAMAYEKTILPNYQVRYSLPDFQLFKNSMVKNVALVDNELQGKEWTSNKGGSGFGKFKNLPNPKTIAWKSNEAFDFYSGSHDGFENIGVNYYRQVIYIKDDFWVVKDSFNADSIHTYKQVWQGHYSMEESPQLLRSTFDDATGCDIYQLRAIDNITAGSARGKQWAVASISNQMSSEFITVVFPYQGYENRIDENETKISIKGWMLNQLNFEAKGEQLTSISKGNSAYIFGTKFISIGQIKVEFEKAIDIYIEQKEGIISIHSLGIKEVELVISGSKNTSVNGFSFKKKTKFKPGEKLDIVIE